MRKMWIGTALAAMLSIGALPAFAIEPGQCAIDDDACARAQLLREIDAILGANGEAVLGESTGPGADALNAAAQARADLLRSVDYTNIPAGEDVLGESTAAGTNALEEAARARADLLDEWRRWAD